MGVVQLPTGVNAGGLGKRFAAQIVDAVVPVVLAGVWTSVAIAAPSFEALLVVSIACGVVGLAYALLLWWMFAARAAGPGMRLMKLQLVGVSDGAPIGWGRFFLRQLVLFACAATGVGLVVVVVLPILHPLHQGWHDLAARSVVIAERVKPQVTARTPSARRPVSSMSVSSTVGLPPHLATQQGFAGQHDSWDAVSSGAFAPETPATSGPISGVPGYNGPTGPIAGVPGGFAPPGPSAADEARWERPPEGRPAPTADRSRDPWGAAPSAPAGSPPGPPALATPAAPPGVVTPPAGAPPSVATSASSSPAPEAPSAGPGVAGLSLPAETGGWGAPRQPTPESSWATSPIAPPVAGRGLEPPAWGAPAAPNTADPSADSGWAPAAQPARAWGVPEASVPPAHDESTESLPVRAVGPEVTAVPAGPVDDGHTHLARPVVRAAGAWALRLDDGREVVLSGTVLIGRNPVARGGEEVSDLVSVGADGRMVSKTHLAVGVDQRGVYVVDRGSTNGTAIATSGGVFEPCAAGDRVRVRDGQVVSFGDHSLVVHRTQG